MPNWRKIILSGSTANLNSLTVTNGITGSLFGTASYISPTFISASAAESGFGVFIANNTDNYVVTATGTSGSLNGESALTFNGTTLGVGITTPYSSAKAHIKGILGVENGSTAGNLSDQLLFGYNGSGLTQYTHKIQTSHDAQPVLNKMDFLVSNGASTFLNVLTLRSLSLSRFNSGQGLGVSGSLQVTGSAIVTGNINAASFTGSLYGSASYATSASYAPSTPTFPYTGAAQITGSLLVTGSTTQIGNNTLIGNTVLSGSISVTGSQTFVGSHSLTGSFLVTGSTTQIGTNNLLGNTILSGSIIISGSTTSPATPTIKVFGDMETNGVIKFLPVTKNIDTSVSASYIYVSGSTNDLYFSQNGSGYNNVTRLRWLEGNMYSGLFNGGLITTQSSTIYQVASGSGIVVNLNASLNDNPYPTVTYVNWGILSASIAPLTASYDQQFVSILSNGTLFAQGTPFEGGQRDTQIPLGIVLHQNRSTINGVKTQPEVAYALKQRTHLFVDAFGPLKLSGHVLSVSGSSTGSLIIPSGTSFSDGANYQTDPNNPSLVTDAGTTVSKIFRYHQSGSAAWVYDTNGGAGYGVINPTQYSNNGVLTAVPGGGSNKQWSIQRAFWYPNSVTKAIVVYYGNAVYDTEVEAIANLSTEAFTEAPNTAANAIYVGALVLRNDANFTVAASYKILPGGLFRQVGGSGGGGSTITQTLAGLSDVAISGPTNGQPLVYNTTATKWQNQSTLTATLIGNATSATTASLVNGTVNVTTATIGNTLYATAGTTIGAGTTSIYSVSNASYSSIFVDYSINEGTTNARAGTIQVISVGSDINYTETTTMDIGNTSDITWDIYLSGADINFDIVNAAGASWRIKFSSRQM